MGGDDDAMLHARCEVNSVTLLRVRLMHSWNNDAMHCISLKFNISFDFKDEKVVGLYPSIQLKKDMQHTARHNLLLADVRLRLANYTILFEMYSTKPWVDYKGVHDLLCRCRDSWTALHSNAR